MERPKTKRPRPPKRLLKKTDPLALKRVLDQLVKELPEGEVRNLIAAARNKEWESFVRKEEEGNARR